MDFFWFFFLISVSHYYTFLWWLEINICLFFKLNRKIKIIMTDPSWKYGKNSDIDWSIVKCVFCNKQSKGRIFRHKEHMMGTSKIVVWCSKCPDVVREEIRRYVEEKRDLKRQILHQPDVRILVMMKMKKWRKVKLLIYHFIQSQKTINECNSLFKVQINR